MNYVIAWDCLLVVLRNGYDLGCWIAPIPEEHKLEMLNKAIRFLQDEHKKEQPQLF